MKRSTISIGLTVHVEHEAVGIAADDTISVEEATMAMATIAAATTTVAQTREAYGEATVEEVEEDIEGFRQKKCYVCNQPGCWSNKHTLDERKEAYSRFRQQAQYTTDQEVTPQYYQTFLGQYEGIEGLDDDDEATQMLTNMSIDEEFELIGNLIHWSSTKSKRVTRSVLASEVYGMIGGICR
jgi:DNA repair exonuclease SbcCD ATPase subunit